MSTLEEKEKMIKNIRALLPKISAKLDSVEEETDLLASYSDRRNYETLNRKCYELRDLVNELIFETR